MARSLVAREQLFPTLPGIRSIPNLDKELSDLEAYQEWNLNIGGTYPEYLVYRELERAGLERGVDFDFQSSLFGGRNRLGGAIVDFILFGYIAGRVQGEYFHYRGTEQKITNILQRRKLESEGFIVVDMIDTEIIRMPRLVVSMFIRGQETAEAQSRRG